MIPSIPAVLPPLLVTTFLTAKAFASKLCNSIHCKLYTSFILFFDVAATIFSCRLLIFISAFFQSIPCHPSLVETLFVTLDFCLIIAFRLFQCSGPCLYHVLEQSTHFIIVLFIMYFMSY